MPLHRNFRMTYYKTLGVPVVQHIVDVEASYAALLGEQVVNLAQLSKLALEVGISSTYRDMAWQVLSGVMPPYRCMWDFAADERQQMYRDVADAAQVLQWDDPVVRAWDAQNQWQKEQNQVDPENNDAVVSQKELDEESNRLVRLHRTYWCSIHAYASLRGMDDQQYLVSVARAICTIVHGEAAQFWCFVNLIKLFHGSWQIMDLPNGPLQSFYDISVGEFELIFIRALDETKATHRPYM